MKSVEKTVLIWYSPAEMFGLVTDVAHYPQFLPWCDHAGVREPLPDGMVAEVGIALGGLRQVFVTRNRHVTDREVQLKLVQGPFSTLEGRWQFLPVGDGSQRACKVALELRYGFSNAALGALVGPVFDRIANSLVDAFVARAEQVYGP